MKIGMVFFDMQEFGGLEEYAVALAASLKHKGHQVTTFSTAWVPDDNQYYQQLVENDIPLIQPPKWLSHPASDWETKEKILAVLMWLLTPLTLLLALPLAAAKRRPLRQAFKSAHGWLRGRLMTHLVAPDRRKPFTRLLLQWWRSRWQPDILHLHGYTENLLFVIEWAHARQIPVVYEEHQTPDAQFDWWKDFSSAINKANVVIAVSEKSAEALADVCGVTRPIVVRNPLLADPSQTGWRPPENFPPADAPLHLTTVARLYVTKGLTYLLDAIVQVQARFPQARFTVYGDGPLREELLAKAGRLGLPGEEIFAGPFTHKDLPQIMERTDIFVLPSILEGQPLALVEAMAYGCPIAATAVGGVPELIKHEKNGLLCPSGDPDRLARSIISLIENPDLRAKFSRAARSSYEQGPYQPDAVGAHFEEIYGDVLDNHGRGRPAAQPHAGAV